MRMNTKLPTKALAKQAISSGLCILPFEAIIQPKNDIVNEADPLWTVVKLVLIYKAPCECTSQGSAQAPKSKTLSMLKETISQRI